MISRTSNGCSAKARNGGVALSYAEQPSPNGLAQAVVIWERFVRGRKSAPVLGNNICHGAGLVELLDLANRRGQGAPLFAYLRA